MDAYKTKASKLPGTNLKEVSKNARKAYKKAIANEKRKPFIRSAYFKKEKIFFDYFWTHLKQKNSRARFKRLKYFEAAVELIRNSKNTPLVDRRSEKNEVFYRFMGAVGNSGENFFVQIKENKKSKNKYFMSCFPDE